MNAHIVLIAAIARNGVIGRDNRLIWRLKSDLKRFRSLTMGHAMIVGRKTFQSIGKPLPGRHMIVISRDPDFAPEGVFVARSLDEARAEGLRFATAQWQSSVFVAGGGEIYTGFLDEAKRLEITEVDLEPDGDAHFPRINPAHWRVASQENFTKSVDDEASGRFLVYERR